MGATSKVLMALSVAATPQSTDDLERTTGVNPSTVRTILRRHRDLLHAQPDPQGLRGGVHKLWSVRPEKRASVAAELAARSPILNESSIPDELALLHHRLVHSSVNMASERRDSLLALARAILSRLSGVLSHDPKYALTLKTDSVLAEFISLEGKSDEDFEVEPEDLAGLRIRVTNAFRAADSAGEADLAKDLLLRLAQSPFAPFLAPTADSVDVEDTTQRPSSHSKPTYSREEDALAREYPPEVHAALDGFAKVRLLAGQFDAPATLLLEYIDQLEPAA